MTVSDRIDKFLRDTQNGEYWFLSEEDPDNQYEIVQKALSCELVVRDGRTFELTQKGYEVIEAGGYDNWNAARKKREDETHQATVKSANATRYAYLVSLATFLFAVFTYWQGGNREEKLTARVDSLSRKLFSTDSLLKRQMRPQKRTLPSVNGVKSDS